MKINIEKIIIGQRLRTEYGDMEGLANSIKKHGLIHPIVIDKDCNLVAGGRRLLACDRIGLKEVEVKILGELPEKELRILELEENIHRKDLTELEKSKNLVELAEIKEQELKERKKREESEMNSFNGVRENLGGRPATNGISVKNISEELDIPSQTIRDAKQHVKAVEEFPELETLPKYKAIETAKELRQAPEEEHDKILDLAQQRKKREQAQEAQEDNYYRYIDECTKVAKKFNDALFGVTMLDVSDKTLSMWKEHLITYLPEDYLSQVEDAIPKFIKIQKFLKEVLDGKRQITKSKGKGSY